MRGLAVFPLLLFPALAPDVVLSCAQVSLRWILLRRPIFLLLSPVFV